MLIIVIFITHCCLWLLFTYYKLCSKASVAERYKTFVAYRRLPCKRSRVQITGLAWHLSCGLTKKSARAACELKNSCVRSWVSRPCPITCAGRTLAYHLHSCHSHVNRWHIRVIARTCLRAVHLSASC